MEGDFVLNEFGALTPDELHFLRVFIYCEGGIRDMEAALGVSYPTVKGHLASIKEKLNLTRLGKSPSAGVREPADGAALEPGAARSANAVTAEEVLDRLEQGTISYKDAVRLLRANPSSTSAPSAPSTSAPNPPSTSARKKKEEKTDEQSG